MFRVWSAVFALLLGAGAGAQGVDARAVLTAQQAKLGKAPGVLVLDQPSHLEGELTLSAGQSLRILAPLLVGRGGIRLAGQNEVRCEAPVTVTEATELFVADGVSDISVRGCDVTAIGLGSGTLLTATRSSRVVATDNHLTGLALFNTHNTGGPASQTTDVTLNGNSVLIPRGNGPIGAYLMYVLRATVANNRFMGTGHGVEWWGGDGNVGWRGAAAVTGAGNMSITGNQCYAAGGACVWGSMGFNITVSGNSADNCGDVCFDSEGGVRNLFIGNVAQHCAAGCFSVQMESVDVVFSGNFAYADEKNPALALFLIKHRNGNPAPHLNLTVTGNTMSCGSVCTAFYTEGESGLDLSRNTMTNGVIQFANYTNTVLIRDNSLRFSLPLAGRAAISGPSVAWGHVAMIENNLILNDSGVFDPKSTCIVESWSDDNNSDEMRLKGNTCDGFGMGIVTDTAGHNAGAPHATWVLRGNVFVHVPPGQERVHHHTSGNESYTADSAKVE